MRNFRTHRVRGAKLSMLLVFEWA